MYEVDTFCFSVYNVVFGQVKEDSIFINVSHDKHL